MEKEVSIDELVKASLGNNKRIVLYNDDKNTFEQVIDCLTKYCKHSVMQAEQCAMIVHYNGKCSVKEGDFMDLIPIHGALVDNNLKAEIE
jgi:ATP-dependent Clp protease adaptor protein ClpS